MPTAAGPPDRVEPAQVVRGEAGANEHGAAVAPRGQRLPELKQALRVKRGRKCGQGHLHDRDVRVGEHLLERDVLAVVKAAGLVALTWRPCVPVGRATSSNNKGQGAVDDDTLPLR